MMIMMMTTIVGDVDNDVNYDDDEDGHGDDEDNDDDDDDDDDDDHDGDVIKYRRMKIIGLNHILQFQSL